MDFFDKFKYVVWFIVIVLSIILVLFIINYLIDAIEIVNNMVSIL